MSTQAALKQGKKRKQNFTSAECALLVDLVEKYMDTLRGQFSSSITNAKKQELWKTIASRINVNSLGYEKRTLSEIRDKWRNMTQIARKTNSGIMYSRQVKHLKLLLTLNLNFKCKNRQVPWKLVVNLIQMQTKVSQILVYIGVRLRLELPERIYFSSLSLV